jgi:raffinose/stachyose/melibiose transport system substrate-binding protein
MALGGGFMRIFGKLMLATVIATAGHTAAAQDSDAISGSITFYTHFTQFVDDDRWEGWAKTFQERYPNATVEIIPVANYRKEIPTRIASGDYGDVLNVLDNLPPADYAKFYEPLTDMSLATTHSFVDRYRVEGEVYGYIYG